MKVLVAMRITYLACTIICLFVLATNHALGQEKSSGRVLDQQLIPIPGVKIYNKDTIELASTDYDGHFKLKGSFNRLIIGGLGYEWTTISDIGNCYDIEIILPEGGTYDYRSHRKIDRIRKRYYENIPLVHEKAYEAGFI